MASLLELVQTAVTPDITKRISGVVGESPAATDAAMQRAMPAVLAGIVNNASTPAGAERLTALIKEGGWGADVLANLGGRLVGGSGTSSLLSSGARLISVLFGTKTDSLTDLIASGGGVQRSSASSILSLMAPIVMSVIGKQISSRGLDASALSTMLSGERSSLLNALPAGVGGLLGMKDVSRTVTDVAAPLTGVGPSTERDRYGPLDREEIPPARARAGNSASLKRSWPALALALAALAMLFLIGRGSQPDVASKRADVPAASPRQTTSITLPGGARVNVEQGGPVQQLSSYLADRSTTDTTPKRFVFSDLNFETGSAALRADSQATVDSLLAVLEAYPSVQVSLEGHTDSTGDAAANKALSEQRAEAVKQTLVNGGIAPERVDAQGFGQERPLADNNTEAGRATNRRLEVVVLKR
jgi:outer membrane protein OmpA-like peptidoglycan-associated protein